VLAWHGLGLTMPSLRLMTMLEKLALLVLI